MPATKAGYSKRSRIDKLGLKPDMRIAVLGIDGVAKLKRLATVQKSIKRNGMIWAIWPKGQQHIKEDMIRKAAIDHGLVDVKVMAFSETLSGLKLVIPVAKR